MCRLCLPNMDPFRGGGEIAVVKQAGRRLPGTPAPSVRHVPIGRSGCCSALYIVCARVVPAVDIPATRTGPVSIRSASLRTAKRVPSLRYSERRGGARQDGTHCVACRGGWWEGVHTRERPWREAPSIPKTPDNLSRSAARVEASIPCPAVISAVTGWRRKRRTYPIPPQPVNHLVSRMQLDKCW